MDIKGRGIRHYGGVARRINGLGLHRQLAVCQSGDIHTDDSEGACVGVDCYMLRVNCDCFTGAVGDHKRCQCGRVIDRAGDLCTMRFLRIDYVVQVAAVGEINGAWVDMGIYGDRPTHRNGDIHQRRHTGKRVTCWKMVGHCCARREVLDAAIGGIESVGEPAMRGDCHITILCLEHACFETCGKDTGQNQFRMVIDKLFLHSHMIVLILLVVIIEQFILIIPALRLTVGKIGMNEGGLIQKNLFVIG